MQTDFSILDYGADTDADTLNTGAIQKAIDACHTAGGGRVFCPRGAYRTGSITLRSHVELHLAVGCRLIGSTDENDYLDFDAPGFRKERSPEKTSKALIRAIDAQDVAITGPGLVDGSGIAFYDTSSAHEGVREFFKKPDNHRPRMVMMLRCTDVRIEQASFVDSPCWTFWLMQCHRVNIHRIKVYGDQRMINNDGIDIDSCRDVTIGDSILKTGDDCIILRAIDGVFDEPRPCENITVSNCVLDSWCQGVRIGCPCDGTIRNATFTNLAIVSLNNGILFENPKRYVREGRTPTADIHDILFSNLSIDAEGAGIRVNVEEGIALKRLSNISFSDFRIRTGRPCAVHGSAETTIRDVRFSNGTIEGEGDDVLLMRNCDGVEMNSVRLTHRTI